LDEKYKAMLFGIAAFVGGMVAMFIIKKVLENKPISEVVSSDNILQTMPVESVETMPVAEEKARLDTLDIFDLNVDVTDKVEDIHISKAKYKLPWTSFDLDNNGPDPVFFSVNKWNSPQAPLNAGQSIHINLKKSRGIRRVFLKCDKGQNTNVSLFIHK